MADYKPNFRMTLTNTAGDFSGNPSSLGDTGGGAVEYQFVLCEYPNDMALTRNRGPEREGGMIGGTGVRILKSSDRKTGRIDLVFFRRREWPVVRLLPAPFLCHTLVDSED